MPSKKKTPPPEIPSIQEEAGLPPNWEPINSAPIDPNNPQSVGAPPAPSGRGSFQTGALPANFGLETDLANTGTPPSVPSVRLMPTYGSPQQGAAIQSAATDIVNAAIASIPPVVFPSTGQVNKQTGDYTAMANDTEKLISFNIVANSTLTLPATSAGVSWFILVENNGSAMLTINPNGLNLDYTANSIILGPNQGLTIYSDGTNYFTERGVSDGLAHGSSPTETDSSSVSMVDDFTSGNETSGSIGALNWKLGGGGGGALYRGGSWTAPNFGTIFLNSTGSANGGVNLIPFDVTSAWGGSVAPAGFPLTYNTGWDSSFIFRRPKIGFGSGTANTTAKTRLYLGFAFLSTASDVKRPAKFIGLRYDTDPGPAVTITSVGAAGSGVYNATGGFAGGAGNALVGAKFIITGFTAPNTANNGTFTATASTATAITVNNPSSTGSSTGSPIATGPQLADTTYKFECVQNASDALNIQGSVFDTGIAPDNNWHRFRMRSIVQGQILFSIDGGTETKLSMGTDTPIGSGSSFSLEIFGNYNSIVGNTNVLANGGTWAAAPAWGTPATLAGCTSTAAVLNGTYPVGDNALASTSIAIFLNSGVNSSASETSSTPTITWYNAFYPLILFGNDSESGSSVSSIQIDWFSFVYNPGLAADFNQSPDPTKARFFNGQT
jgi:hypothetical protein